MQSILVFQKTIKNAHTVAHGLFKQGKQSEQLAGGEATICLQVKWQCDYGYNFAIYCQEMRN